VLATVVSIGAGCSRGSDDTTPHRRGGVEQQRGGGEKSIEEFGDEAVGSERAAVKGAFTDYLSAISAGDFQAACSHLAANVRKSLEQLVVKRLRGKSCMTILPKLLSGSAAAIAREQAEGEITKVRVEGNRGFIVFHSPGARLYQMTMVREGGEWKTATVTSSVLVPSLAALGQR
jgi:hypothetical protein